MTAAAARARVLTAAALTALGLWVAARGRVSAPVQPQSPPVAAAAPLAEAIPQDVIYAMFDAARAGDTAAYARCFAGRLAEDVARTMADQGGPEPFARYLRETHGPVKGLAVDGPKEAPEAGPGTVKSRVEYVYADRNEVQWMYLGKDSGGAWRILRMERMERVKTAVPYGAAAVQ